MYVNIWYRKSTGIPTFFCLNLMANLSLFKCILSPCSKAGPVGSWLRSTSSSYELRVWSNKAVAKSWHCFRNSWYSFLNSCSIKLNLQQTRMPDRNVRDLMYMAWKIFAGFAVETFTVMNDCWKFIWKLMWDLVWKLVLFLKYNIPLLWHISRDE